jgi:predicted dehydrogenase
VPEVVKHAGFGLLAVVDPLTERLADARNEFSVKGYTCVDEMLESEHPDLVVIASPTPFHAEQAIACMAHGADVFCDKPMALSLSQAEGMVAAMRAHGRRLMLYQPHRAGAQVVALRDILAKDLIGPVYMIKRGIARYARRNDWQAFRRNGGGMLNNYGAHYVDQLLYLAGSPARRVSCALRTVASLGDADDVVKVLIETESGIILDLDITMASAHPMPSWQVLGKRGSVVYDEDEAVWRVRYFLEDELDDVQLQSGLAAKGRRYGSGEEIPWREAAFATADYCQVDFYEECYRYFGKGEPPFVPVAETLAVMRVLDACRQDAEHGERSAG